jgi:glycine oxidase
VHVVVIGAGVMGCASALALARRGARVTLLERAVPGAEASSAAAGILGAQAESREAPTLRNLFVRARDEYAAWAETLEADTGIAVGHRVSGLLHVAHDAEERDELATLVASQRKEGLRAEILDAAEACRVEPELRPGTAGAAYFPDDAQVDPPALLRALVAAVSRAGVVVKAGTVVHRVLVERDACVGVMLDDGKLLGDATVLAAGSWSSLVPGVPSAIPTVKPARGQMVLLEERPPRVRTILFARSGYVVPRGDGRVLCGSTLEFVGFRREVTAGGVQAILKSALDLAPGLASAQLSTFWNAFRPYSSIDAPLMGASPLPGFFLATGHHRNGILLAKVTADTVADAILGSATP